MYYCYSPYLLRQDIWSNRVLIYFSRWALPQTMAEAGFFRMVSPELLLEPLDLTLAII